MALRRRRCVLKYGTHWKVLSVPRLTLDPENASGFYASNSDQLRTRYRALLCRGYTSVSFVVRCEARAHRACLTGGVARAWRVPPRACRYTLPMTTLSRWPRPLGGHILSWASNWRWGTPIRWARPSGRARHPGGARPPGGRALPVGAPSRWARPPGGRALPVGAPSRSARPPGGHAFPVGTPSRWARLPGGHARSGGSGGCLSLNNFMVCAALTV